MARESDDLRRHSAREPSQDSPSTTLRVLAAPVSGCLDIHCWQVALNPPGVAVVGVHHSMAPEAGDEVPAERDMASEQLRRLSNLSTPPAILPLSLPCPIPSHCPILPPFHHCWKLSFK